MKLIKRKISCAFILLLIATMCQAQLTTPYNVRNKHIAELYQLSDQQVINYNKELNVIESKWSIIKDTKLSPDNRKVAERKLFEEFKIRIKKIFPEAQFNKWNKNHRGNLRVRFYKEDLGMNSKQYSEFRRISKIYSDAKHNIQQMDLSFIDISRYRTEAFNQYSNSLYNIFPTQLADYLIYENEVLNTAKTLSRRYTIITENKAIQIAILKIQYDKNREELEKLNLSSNNMRQKRRHLEDEYDESLRSLLDNKEYVTYAKARDQFTDKKHMDTYKMSTKQLAQYKELKKKLAMEQLIIKQTKMDKGLKLSKLQEINSTFEEQLKSILTTNQFKKWIKDKSNNK